MTKGPSRSDAAGDREARLKAALRANLVRRKAQGRARDAQHPKDDEQQGHSVSTEDRSPGNEE
nr:hypothetical protein [Paracoccus shanxieyensis]